MGEALEGEGAEHEGDTQAQGIDGQQTRALGRGGLRARAAKAMPRGNDPAIPGALGTGTKAVCEKSAGRQPVICKSAMAMITKPAARRSSSR